VPQFEHCGVSPNHSLADRHRSVSRRPGCSRLGHFDSSIAKDPDRHPEDSAVYEDTSPVYNIALPGIFSTKREERCTKP
jgi:hypothetical protein